ncbi:MAG: hypothetical protein HY010_01825 [Acidobacteria bacterium]|nr:hypothetical protein [Acidobacteriota bacterium]
MLHQLQAGAIFFASLVKRHNRPTQGRELAQFLLDILQPFMALAVRDLLHSTATLLAPILLILLVNFGDFRS